MRREIKPPLLTAALFVCASKLLGRAVGQHFLTLYSFHRARILYLVADTLPENMVVHNLHCYSAFRQ